MGVRAATKQGYTQLLFRVGPSMEWAGFQVLPTHYYSPVPSLRALRGDPAVLNEPSTLPGIDLAVDRQREMVDRLAEFADEVAALDAYEAVEGRSSGEGYGVADAEILYTWLRATKPKRMIEVGSGVSTHYAAMALAANGATGEVATLTCIEPFRWHGLRDLATEHVHVEVVRSLVQDVELSVFEQLEPGDLLFIDSTHVVKSGSDTGFLVLEVLPRLAPGVVVHIHDIPLPFEFVNPDVILREHMFWNEVALIRAFLMFNETFAVSLASFWMAREQPDVLRRAVPSLGRPGVVPPCSLWIERVR